MVEISKESKITELTEEQLEKQLEIVRDLKEKKRLERERVEAEKVRKREEKERKKLEIYHQKRNDNLTQLLSEYKLTEPNYKAIKYEWADQTRNALKIEFLKGEIEKLGLKMVYNKNQLKRFNPRKPDEQILFIAQLEIEYYRLKLSKEGKK